MLLRILSNLFLAYLKTEKLKIRFMELRFLFYCYHYIHASEQKITSSILILKIV